MSNTIRYHLTSAERALLLAFVRAKIESMRARGYTPEGRDYFNCAFRWLTDTYGQTERGLYAAAKTASDEAYPCYLALKCDDEPAFSSTHANQVVADCARDYRNWQARQRAASRKVSDLVVCA